MEYAKVSVMSSVSKALAGALAVIALANAAHAQGVIFERNVSTQLARAIADAAMECATKRYPFRTGDSCFCRFADRERIASQTC